MSANASSTRPLSVRIAEKRDIPAIRDMAERTWRQSYAEMISPEQMDYMLERMYAPEVIAREIDDGVIWELACSEEGPVGFSSCGFDAGDRSVKLQKLYVLPEAQGRGCGQALLGRVRDLAIKVGAQKIWLQVNKRNAAAIRAYQRAGYGVEREAVFDIGSGFVMDDYIMTLAVPEVRPLSSKDAAVIGT